ncbi:MAG: hypothetical protein IKO20_04105 [Bacteroidaceae bacterium]|nr:hypothetical protein [Bacteroidaceae bacterium]
MTDKKYIIDGNYFHGVLSLGTNVQYAQPNAGGTTARANSYLLNKQIEAFEPEYLMRLFGLNFSVALYTYLRRGDTSEVEERWETLLSLLRADDGGVSPIAAYVYFRILETRQAHVTETGVSLGAGDDAASPVPLQVQAWGLMVDANAVILDYVKENFTEYDICFTPAILERVNSLGL